MKKLRTLKIIHSRDLLPYAATLEEQLNKVQAILWPSGEEPYELHFLEHSHVLTKGRGFEQSHMIGNEAALEARGWRLSMCLVEGQ